MPLARIITRFVDQSQEMAAELRGRGYEVEIVPASDIPKSRADVEIHVEECTPEEALIRAGVLPDRSDMSVFIAPGAIAGGHLRHLVQANSVREKGERPVQKWFQATSNESTLSDEQLKTELQSIETAHAVESESKTRESADAVRVERTPVTSDLISSFSAELASAPLIPGNTARSMLNSPAATSAQRRPAMAKAGTASSRIVSEIDEVLGHPVELIRKQSKRLRIQIPALAGIKLDAFKSRAFLVGLAVVVIAMAAWVLRRAPAPAQIGVTPAAAAAPIAAPSVQQAVVPSPKIKSRGIRPQASKVAQAQSTSKVSAAKKDDGIKRYSDLD